MAKLTPVVLENEKPTREGKYNVKIRIGHKSKNSCLAIDLYVGKKDIVKDSVNIKPDWIVDYAVMGKYHMPK